MADKKSPSKKQRKIQNPNSRAGHYRPEQEILYFGEPIPLLNVLRMHSGVIILDDHAAAFHMEPCPGVILMKSRPPSFLRLWLCGCTRSARGGFGRARGYAP
jgi:hypothetical protein